MLKYGKALLFNLIFNTIYMEQMRPTLSFFAQILQTDKDFLEFILIKRKDNGEKRPAITVKGIRKYVFDINFGQFVEAEKYVMIRTNIVKYDQDIVFIDSKGVCLKYTQDDFLKVYSKRVVNDSLY